MKGGVYSVYNGCCKFTNINTYYYFYFALYDVRSVFIPYTILNYTERWTAYKLLKRCAKSD